MPLVPKILYTFEIKFLTSHIPLNKFVIYNSKYTYILYVFYPALFIFHILHDIFVHIPTWTFTKQSYQSSEVGNMSVKNIKIRHNENETDRT